MATQSMDALTSFQHVADNIEKWRSSLSELAVYATKQHETYAAEYSRLLDQVRTKKRKSDSIVSIHSNDEDPTSVKDVAILHPPNPSELVEISPFEAGNRFIYAQANRKRKPGTSLRSNSTETTKYRNKQMVVIYYDSHVQSELDKLVKSLGTARNNLRKGKNAYTAAKGFSLPTLNRRRESANATVSNPPSKPSLSTPKLPTNASTATVSEPTSIDAAFPTTDKELEAIQVLCEKAAHQILRDGDCKTELYAALKKIDPIFTCVDTALSLLRTETSPDESSERSAEDSTVSGGTLSASTSNNKSPQTNTSTYHKTLSPQIASLAAQRPPFMAEHHGPPSVLAADAIEVDDNSSDSMADIDLDVAKYRSAARSRLIS